MHTQSRMGTPSLSVLVPGDQATDALGELILDVPHRRAWTRHVGELRLVVHPAHRRRRLGSVLARWALLQAAERGLRKLTVEIVAEQEAAEALFRNLGFQPEAVLVDQIRDREGEFRDLLLLAHQLDGNWSGMATLGLGGD